MYDGNNARVDTGVVEKVKAVKIHHTTNHVNYLTQPTYYSTYPPFITIYDLPWLL